MGQPYATASPGFQRIPAAPRTPARDEQQKHAPPRVRLLVFDEAEVSLAATSSRIWRSGQQARNCAVSEATRLCRRPLVGLRGADNIRGTSRPPDGAQRAREKRESAVRRFRQDPRVPAEQVLADYDRWLERQALAARTRASYRRWVRELVAHLDSGDELQAFLARDGEHDRRAVLGDWRRRLVDRGLAPLTVNLALAAATSLRDSRALPAPRVPRVEIDPSAPRALTPE
jgi:hypothetical protein